ncbi:MAG: hypothetical protein QM817_40535 [Archangium sp.]
MSLEQLDAATWFPKARRDVLKRTFATASPAARDVLPFAIATHNATALEFWRELAHEYTRRDTQGFLTRPILEHLLTVAGRKTLKPAALRGEIETYLVAAQGPNSAADARTKILSIGNEVSLGNAHGIYISAARKAPKSAWPKSPPHLNGPVPVLTVFETAEVTIALAKLALERSKNAEGEKVLQIARKQLAWHRDGAKGAGFAVTHATRDSKLFAVPPTDKKKGPGFALARAALMEACNVNHISGRGTSIKMAVMHGLELGEAWWLEQVDEALMLADARAAFEKRNQQPSKPIEHLVWRGGDKTTSLWLVRLKATPPRYALLAKLGRNWTTQEGDLESVAATIPEAWFARAMPVVELRRNT